MWEIKVFTCEKKNLETRVNDWLKEQLGMEVFQMTQTESASSAAEITLTIQFRSVVP